MILAHSKLIRVDYPIGFITSFVLSCFLSLAIGFSILPALRSVNSTKCLSESSFIEAGYLSGPRSTNTYYSDLDYTSIKKDTETSLTSTVFMTIPGVDYRDSFMVKRNGTNIEDNLLNDGEASVSETFSRHYGVGEGDFVTIRSFFTDYRYQIKYVFDGYYGLSDYSPLEDSYLLVAGYSSEFISKEANASYYHFSNDHSLFSKEPIFDKGKAIKSNQELCYLVMSLTSILCLASLVIIDTLFSKGTCDDLSYHESAGKPKRWLVLFSLKDSAIKYTCFFILPLAVSLVVPIFSTRYSLIPAIFVLCWLVLSVGVSFAHCCFSLRRLTNGK